MSEWKVSKTIAGGEVFYQVYRKRDDGEVDHSGNREIAATFLNYELAFECADQLNKNKGEEK